MLTPGLHRQSELTVKEPFRITRSVDDLGQLVLDVVGLGESFVPAEDDEDDDGDNNDNEAAQDDETGDDSDEKAGDSEDSGAREPAVPKWARGSKRWV